MLAFSLTSAVFVLKTHVNFLSLLQVCFFSAQFWKSLPIKLVILYAVFFW